MDATSTIPIVFTTGFDPVATGLVQSLKKPEANVTGATFYSGALVGKQARTLRELAPSIRTIGLLIHATPTSTVATQIASMQAAVIAVGCEFIPLYVEGQAEFATAFASLAKRRDSSLIVSVDPLFDSHRYELVTLAEEYKLPTAYYLREFAEQGGLVSYGASIFETYRNAGVYAWAHPEGRQTFRASSESGRARIVDSSAQTGSCRPGFWTALLTPSGRH